MSRTHDRRGASNLVLVLLVIAAALAVWFFVSKPFQTNVKEGYRQATEWTPENIQKDPIGYLSWALDEVGTTEQKLQAGVLALKTKKNAAERAVGKHTTDKGEYEKLLGEFKEAYRTAESTKKFPVTVRNLNFDETALKRKIVESNDKMVGEAGLLEAYNKTLRIINDKLSELDAKLGDVAKLKNRLSTDLEIAKVNKSVAGLDSIDDQLAAIVDTSAALVRTTEEGTEVSTMIKPSAEARVDDEFSKIMGK